MKIKDVVFKSMGLKRLVGFVMMAIAAKHPEYAELINWAIGLFAAGQVHAMVEK